MAETGLDFAPADGMPLRVRQADGEAWISVVDLARVLTVAEMECQHRDGRDVYAPAFRAVRDIVESVVPGG